MKSNREQLLDDIGFEWDATDNRVNLKNDKWDAMFQQLTAFQDAHGHVDVPQAAGDTQELAICLNAQRFKARRDKLRSVGVRFEKKYK
eukprot:scaffold655_cov162-Amphora_coffeaeformis.AAC.23